LTSYVNEFDADEASNSTVGERAAAVGRAQRIDATSDHMQLCSNEFFYAHCKYGESGEQLIQLFDTKTIRYARVCAVL
jgi:hypothetical protein